MSDVRAGDADRERTVAALRDAAGEGRLTIEELSERVDAAWTARTQAELDVLVRDLPAPSAAPAKPPRAARTIRVLVAIFSSTRRSGPLRLARWLLCLAVFGDVRVDLREAAVDDAATILALAVFANVGISVSERLDGDVHGLAVFGRAHATGRGAAEGPVVRVLAPSVFGNVHLSRGAA